jgi:hypothetical protein
MYKLRLTRLTTPGLRGSHHLPLYSILCASSWGSHPNDILSRDSQVGVPEFPQLGFSRFWGPITSRENLRLQWGLKQSCSHCQKLFNGMFHATCTWGNRGDSWRLVVGNQIGNLTPNLFFGHNLYFKCPNGKFKPILNIYVSIYFQWYNFFSSRWVLTLVIGFWRFGSPFGS